MGDGADTELTEEPVGGSGPCLFACGSLEGMHPVEVGPIAAVDVELVGAGLEGLTVVFDGLVQHDGLGAVEHVESDGCHLIHVLAVGVDEWICGVELSHVCLLYTSDAADDLT